MANSESEMLVNVNEYNDMKIKYESDIIAGEVQIDLLCELVKDQNNKLRKYVLSDEESESSENETDDNYIDIDNGTDIDTEIIMKNIFRL